MSVAVIFVILIIQTWSLCTINHLDIKQSSSKVPDQELEQENHSTTMASVVESLAANTDYKRPNSTGSIFGNLTSNRPLPSSNEQTLIDQELEQNNLSSTMASIAEARIVNTSYSSTNFTEHIIGVIGNLTSNKSSTECLASLHFSVSQPYSTPHIECNGRYFPDCPLMKRIFQNRVLPYNVSIGFDYGDFTSNPKDQTCLVNASPEAVLCVPNMEDRIRMLRPGRAKFYGWDIPPRNLTPWDQRDPKPVFRGAAWQATDCDVCKAPNFTVASFIHCVRPHFRARWRAVQYSLQNPSLLNARFSTKTSAFHKECDNARSRDSEFAEMTTWNRINKTDYFSKYQTALVLRGFGPSYRVSQHLMAGTAIILQDCYLKEWYTPYLKPFVHFIPLAQDLGNLTEVLEWTQKHPAKVKEIADNGFAFHEKYLTFEKHEEHFHELLWRMSEHRHSKTNSPDGAVLHHN